MMYLYLLNKSNSNLLHVNSDSWPLTLIIVLLTTRSLSAHDLPYVIDFKLIADIKLPQCHSDGYFNIWCFLFLTSSSSSHTTKSEMFEYIKRV